MRLPPVNLGSFAENPSSFAKINPPSFLVQKSCALAPAAVGFCSYSPKGF
jgi:hypothetical protein